MILDPRSRPGHHLSLQGPPRRLEPPEGAPPFVDFASCESAYVLFDVARTHASSRPSSVRRSSGSAIATIVGFVVLLVGVCAMHGFLPGTSPPMVWTIEDSGLNKSAFTMRDGRRLSGFTATW